MMAKMPTMIRRALMRMSPTKKTRTMKRPMKESAEKAMESGIARKYCFAGQRWHDLRGGHAHERRDGDDGVASRAQGVNEVGKSGDGDGAIAATIVHEDDGAAKLRLCLHGIQLVEHELGDLFRGLAIALIPVVGVDLVADHGEAKLLYAHDGRGLVIGLGLFVDIVGRTEIKRLHAEFAGEESFCQLHLKVESIERNFADVGMEEGVVADLVAFALHALHEPNIFLGLRTDHHERTLDAASL